MRASRWQLIPAVSLLAVGAASFAVKGSRPSDIGVLGPLIPFHKDAIHASVVWNGNEDPELCFWMRPSEWRGTDLVDPEPGETGQLRPEFDELVYGGFGFGQLDRSVMSRIKSDIAREQVQCADLTHPDVFANTGKFDVRELDVADFEMNAAAFRDAGGSKGLNYNLFCAGNVSLPDGRILVVGGHDKGGNNGIRKTNIYDPVTGLWTPRPMPQVRADYIADPSGEEFEHADPLDENNTDPTHEADMHLQRWYPSPVTLPDGRVLILSGSDQDTSLGPDLAFTSKVRQAVPEVWDPATGETIVLENARKLLPMFPRSFVVQTGAGADGWKVFVVGEVALPLPTNLASYDPFDYNGNSYLLDVLGALADPDRDVPAENHWELVDTAFASHESGAAVMLNVLDDQGMGVSKKIVVLGGDSLVEGRTAAVESIDFATDDPHWIRHQDLGLPVTQNNAAVMPDGEVLVVGGEGPRIGGERVNELTYQIFDPETGTVRPVAETTVPRHDHSTLLLLPDATVISMGGNRVELAEEDEDIGVPVGQIYEPAYLFQGDRPKIHSAPGEIEYGTQFEIKATGQAESVVMVRTGPITHNWSWGNVYVKLSAKRHRGKLQVAAPAVPGLAVPGIYLLYVLDEDGVPSVARRVKLGS